MTEENSKIKSILLGVGVFLALNSALAFYTVFQRRKAEAPHVQCAQKRWGWTHALEQLEWNLRRWEMAAPKCIEAGMPLVTQVESSSEYIVQELESVRPVIEDSRPPTVIVTSNHLFRSGSLVWLCGEGKFFQARITGTISSGQTRTLIDLKFEGGEAPTNLPVGMMVVAANPSHYSLVKSRGGAGSILTVKKFMQAAAPVAVGVDSISIDLDRKTQGSTEAHLALNADQCRLEHTFAMGSVFPGANRGVWVLKEEGLTFAPWVVSTNSSEGK